MMIIKLAPPFAKWRKQLALLRSHAQRPMNFLNRFSSSNPTHIILDLAMPGADGVEVMRRLAQEQCHATPCRAVGN
ncbi:hypothetical protein CWE24_06130 [Pseudidiomarina donghaiensis]|uniref:Response regulatory domain-containing protein n=1 Tax=Pseudidiomarina donghaiensis TaxID=519452 RepID=A0A432XI01_9GAMM|nr:hypothetical protein CWE24_06130 [Pseudidiomarina donghaiensis]